MEKDKTQSIQMHPIKHILADGTELDSIEGLVVPPYGQTEAVYRLAAMIIMERVKTQM